MNEELVRTNDIDLTPAELRAIEEHKYFLSLERRAEVSIGEAIRDFLDRFLKDWRREKTRRDLQEQIHAIERHRQARSAAAGGDVDHAVVAEEWCEKYAHIWRAERESLERNDFRRVVVVSRNPAGLHLRPWSLVARTAGVFDCDVYVHKDGMPYWNFLLEGRPFMNVKSVIALLSMGVELGDTLEFIAIGAQAEPALAALRELVERAPEAAAEEGRPAGDDAGRETGGTFTPAR
jgi:phosphotransferase system HPr (HPr) family protein